MAATALKDERKVPVPIRGPQKKDETHKGLAWYGKKDIRVVDAPRPAIGHPLDAIIRITSTTICGSDLHIYGGSFPRSAMQRGDLLGHEFMGVVDEVGESVKNVKPGDRVVASFDIGCGQCDPCSKQLFSLCDCTNDSVAMQKMYGDRTSGMFGYSHLTGGWPGGQAEYARVPFADVNLLKLDEKSAPHRTSDLDLLFLSDILPTAWHANEMGEVGEGDTVAVWGAGPVGILAAHCAQHRGAAKVFLIDEHRYRLEHAERHLDPQRLVTIDLTKKPVMQTIRALVPEGPDVGIEAAGFDYAHSLVHRTEMALSLETDTAEILNEIIMTVRKGGRVSVVGVYISYANHFNIGAFMEKGLTMKAGQTPVQRYWRMLLEKVQANELDPRIVVSHEIPLEQGPAGYRAFNEKDENVGAIKVVMHTKHYQGEYPAKHEGKLEHTEPE